VIEGREPLGHVVSVNTGGVAPLVLPRGVTTSAIVKLPRGGRVGVAGVNLDGDDQADRGAHGGPDRALYAYALEDYAWWEVELNRPLAAGTFGENLTTLGFDPNHALVGERWSVGTALVEVSQPRLPCFKLAARVGIPAFVRTFSDSRRPGTYLRIVSPGAVAAGDRIELHSRPSHEVSVRDVFRIFIDPTADASRLLDVPQLSVAWREWAAQAVDTRRRHARAGGADA
jgi:MOSC domain-containing protein YiiM